MKPCFFSLIATLSVSESFCYSQKYDSKESNLKVKNTKFLGYLYCWRL